MTKPTQTEIAAELGITKAAVSKLKKLGMPVHSADAARAWRARNLRPGRTRNDPGPSPCTLLERVEALVPLGIEALRIGRFELVAAELRRALRAVPLSHRGELNLDFDVWAALIGDDVVGAIRTGAARHVADRASPDVVAEPSKGALDPGDVLYDLACGEMRLLLPV